MTQIKGNVIHSAPSARSEGAKLLALILGYFPYSRKAKRYPKRYGIKFALILISFVGFFPVMIFARMSSENYFIEADSLNAGGDQSTSINYTLQDAFGESVAGRSTSTNYQEESFISSYLFRFFSITAPASASLTGKTISTSAQTTTGTISGVEVIDDGTAGWSATMTFDHFTHVASHKLLSGSNDTVTFSGTYDGTYGILDPPGTYRVEITAGGATGTAVFTWTAPDDVVTESVTTASTVVLAKGVSVDFSTATYGVGDKWSAAVDVFLYTGLTITPSTITVVSGDTGGVTAGSAETLTGTDVTSDSKTVMIGASNNSTGTYQQDESLELTAHANSLEGDFTAAATLTVI